MYAECATVQRVQLLPKEVGDRPPARAIRRALPYLLRQRALPDGSVAQAVVGWERRRFAEVSPHGTSLIDFTVDVRLLAVTLERGMAVYLPAPKSDQGDALVGAVAGVAVCVRGFGQTCRHGTPVEGAPWARARLEAPQPDGSWLASTSGGFMGLPCCARDDDVDEELEDDDEDMEVAD